MRMTCAPAAVALLAACSGEVAGPPAEAEPQLVLQEVVTGLPTPVHVTGAPGSGLLFVVELRGRIRVIENGVRRAEPFLDITDRVLTGGERGLLSVAFHPGFASNRRFYVFYTTLDGDLRIERYQADAAGAFGIRASAVPLLTIEHSSSENHNGGLLLFGPDGMLYASTGDGGTPARSRDPASLLGKILRLDVDAGEPYAIPPDNPYRGVPGALGEIWATGLRNPWRFAMDEGRLWVADVGQRTWEEVNVVPLAPGGADFGWNVMEGAACFTGTTCDSAGLVTPLLAYDHGQGCAITGGSIYRGRAMPSLHGHYFYADYCAGWVRSFRLEGNAVSEAREWPFPVVGNITSFGTDGSGELYLTTGDGGLYRLVPAPDAS